MQVATELPLALLAVLMGVIWLVATLRHAVETEPRGAHPALGTR